MDKNNTKETLTPPITPDSFEDKESEEYMEEQIERITNRQIARCLDHLGNTIAPATSDSIKRSFRFFAEDIKALVIRGETYDTKVQEDRFNR